jgi:multidrug efflux pump subunit AcrB
VESLVTERIVQKLREFDEVKEVRSTSRANLSTVVVSLADEINDVDEVWARIRDKIADTRPMLPPDSMAPEFEVIRVRAFASIVGLVWRGPDKPVYSLLSRTAKELEDELRNIQGTEKVELFGNPNEEIVLEVRQSELAKMGLSVDELAKQIGASDSKMPAGLVRGVSQDMLLEIGGEFDSLARINRIPIQSQQSGRTSYVSDIASLRKGIEEPPRSEALVDGEPAIMVSVSVLANARIDYWNEELQQVLSKFASHLPPDLELKEIFNQNRYVAARINYLVRDLIYSALAVFVVVFFMMGWRSSCVVGLALPLSSCIVFACFRVLGIPLHQMSLSGLVIALGMLEGTAIIIVDEIQRRIRDGEERYEAVRNGISHMALPLFGSASTTVLSFLPIAIMPGPSGEFVGTIGTSVILALTSSLVLSFTLIPALTAFTSPASVQTDTFWTRGYASKWMASLYRKSLVTSFKHPIITVLMGIAISLPGFVALIFLPVQFFPSADRDQLHVEIELSPQASLAETRIVAGQVRDILLRDPRVVSVDWLVGRNAPSFYYNMIGTRQDSPRFAEAIIQTRSVKDMVGLVRQFQTDFDREVPAAQVRLLMLEQGPPYNAPIELRIFGYNESDIRAYGEQIRGLLVRHPDVIQTQADLTDFLPKLVYDVNEAESRLVRMPLASIARQLQSTLEGSIGGSILEGNEEIPIRVRLALDQRRDLPSIETVDLLNDSGLSGRSTVSLSSLGSPKLKAETAIITRFDGKRINEVRAYLQAGVLPSTVLEAIQKDLRKPEYQPPDGCSIEFGGENSKRTEALDQLLGNVMILAAGIVFVLVFSLRSFRAMFIILGIGVLSMGLAISSLWATDFAFGFTAIVGCMGMIGIAINDSIVVLAELRADPSCMAGERDSVVRMVMRSTRHVLCTTFTVGCSFIPMLLEGGTFWPPMAMVIIGGVFGATLLALYWIPAIHILMMRPFSVATSKAT